MKSNRDRYTWYLRPPFKTIFDPTQWWNNEESKDPVAALYELTRRHPLVGDLRLKFINAEWHAHEVGPPLTGVAELGLMYKSLQDLEREHGAVRCLCFIGLKPWSKLSSHDKKFWKESVWRLKGLDYRPAIEQCNSLTTTALHRASVTPLTPEQIEKDIISSALLAHRHGHVLIAVAPDLAMDDANRLLMCAYQDYQKLNPPPKPRARHENWLPLISEFDDAKANPKSELFVRYRRVSDGIHFESE